MAKLCKQCGTKPDDWKHDRFAFIPDPIRCLGCEAIELEREQIPEGEKGIYIPLVPREVIEARDGEGEFQSLTTTDDEGPEQEGGLL